MPSSVLRVIPYDRTQAVLYAHRWAYGRNPAYYDFENLGGDCTNFASQCLFAGCGVMNFTPTYGWYYIDLNNRAPAWTGVPYFYNFLTTNHQGPGPFGREALITEVLPGDFVQLKLTGDIFQHTPVIVAVGPEPTLDHILVAAHTTNANFRPLSSYPIQALRFIHIEGARRWETNGEESPSSYSG